MNKKIRKIFTLIFLVISHPVFCQSNEFGYRGVALGQSRAEVESSAKKEFGDVSQSNLSREMFEFLGMKELISGDARGLKNQQCGLDANEDCMVLKISLTHKKLGENVYKIKVEQGYKNTIPTESLLQGLKEKYGAPRLFFTSGSLNKFIWGGLKTPDKSYQANMLDSKDIDAIDGKFISAVFFNDKGRVPGYHLTIIDSELFRKNGMELQKSSQEILKNESQQNKVKF